MVVAEPHHPISVVLNKLAELSFYRWQEKPSDDKGAKKGLVPKGASTRLTMK